MSSDSQDIHAGWTIEGHLQRKPPEAVALFHRFLAAVEACGPVAIEPTRTGVALHGSRHIFGGVRATATGRRGFLNLTRRVEDPRFGKGAPSTKRLLYHRFLLCCASDLDEEFLGWIREAHAVGQGAHLRSACPAAAPL
jgi:hypothetical protein